jgi:PAS domain-containing protein
MDLGLSGSVINFNIIIKKQSIDAIPIPIFFKDENLIYTGCNRGFATFLGKPMEAIIGKNVYDIDKTLPLRRRIPSLYAAHGFRCSPAAGHWPSLPLP